MSAPLPLSVVFFGSPDFAVPALTVLLERPDLARVVACVSQPDKPQGRGQVLAPPPVKRVAVEHKVLVLQPKTLREPTIQAELKALAADIFIVAAYGKILPVEVLQIPSLGCLNLHASLLPRHRGASPVAHALLAGDSEAGVCLMQMEEGLDTGGVYARTSTPIGDDDNAGTLTDRLAQLSADLLIKEWPKLAAGQLQAVPQPATGATYAKKLSKEDGLIDWQRPAAELFNRIRAFSPWPSAYTFLGGKRVQVLRVAKTAGRNGQVGDALSEGQRLYVVCGSGTLELLELKPEGKRAMSASDFLSGRQESTFHFGGSTS